jgi:leucyl/phenylalanyl-tRNA--protein transferase
MPIPFLAPEDDVTPFPSVSTALSEPNGLLMAGGNLSPKRLIAAYRHGVFPWFEAGEPILWWSPDPRCVIKADDIRITRSLSKTIRNGSFQLTENQAYRTVMTRCAALRAGSSGTWVTDDMINAYCRLHELGVAHSIEVWQDTELVGGLYGIKMGAVFVGESMFSSARDASKVALVHLAKCEKYQLIDCQLETDHLNSMGAVCISRENYIELLNELGNSDNCSA